VSLPLNETLKDAFDPAGSVPLRLYVARSDFWLMSMFCSPKT